MKTDYFDYNLPKELIAQTPHKTRDRSRLMVLHKDRGTIEHRKFYELPTYLATGDILVMNDTKVTPSRLIGHSPFQQKGQDKRSREILLIKKIDNNKWETLIKSSRGLNLNENIIFDEGRIKAKINSKTNNGTFILEFSSCEKLFDLGYMPLPPYIKRDYKEKSIHKLDKIRYQTVYAKNPGAIAAPTAGLHFTKELLENIKSQGIIAATVTLHVGWGTFKSVRTENIKDHEMLPEWFSIPEYTFWDIKKAKRVIAVGTTTVRAIETDSSSGYTNLFIYPSYKFKNTNALITNFHLPKSTLLMLVSAFAGRDFIMEAYNEAIKHKYRFYSYGDAMLIL